MAPIRSQISRTPRANSGVAELLIDEHVVAVRGADDRGDLLLAGGGDRGLDRIEIVVGEEDRVRVILGRGSGRLRWERPAADAVIGVMRHQHLRPPGVGAGDDHGEVVGVRPVLGEHRPVGVVHLGGEELGELDHLRPGGAQHVAAGGGGGGRGIDLGVGVAEQDRPERAHQVDELPAVDIQARAPSPRAMNCG